MADVATTGSEKSLDDFFAKRDKKKKKEKGKGKDVAPVSGPVGLKRNKKEKEKSAKSENQDAQPEKEDEEWKDFEHKEVDYSGLLEVEVPEQKPGGVYRPPGARQTGSKRGPSQGPPEIFSDAQFPSLLSTAKHVETRKDREMEKTFEVVKHRNRAREDVAGASMQHLQLDNQYAILGDK
ncbi:protein CDV3-like [Scleropages formosus]|uniref:Protein CDV3-like n=1 Tax=Scleropages formosus TaxID=113540 RepID=A0A0P7WTY5_SCLFO|nr:protein CDV3-like [Scleropages formosus]